MERGPEFTPVEGKTVSDDFAGATFDGKLKSPRIGRNLMLTVDYELEPGSECAPATRHPSLVLT